MAEKLDVIFNDSAMFDKILKEGLPEGGDMSFITKDDATTAGSPAVMVAWTVQLPDGTIRQVQAVTTLNLLRAALTAIVGKYGSFDHHCN